MQEIASRRSSRNRVETAREIAESRRVALTRKGTNRIESGRETEEREREIVRAHRQGQGLLVNCMSAAWYYDLEAAGVLPLSLTLSLSVSISIRTEALKRVCYAETGSQLCFWPTFCERLF